MSLKGFYKLLLVVLGISIAGIYLFISSPIRVSAQLKLKGSARDLYALLGNENTWKQWVKKEGHHPGFNYHFMKNSYPAIFIEAGIPNKIIPVRIEIIPAANKDSAVLGWRCEIPAGITPWSRLRFYIQARQLKKDFSGVIRQIIDSASDTKNRYGITISESVVKDTLIATLSRIESTLPSASLGCAMVNELRQQVNEEGLTVTGSPMTLIRVEEKNYKIMVGLPVNKIPGPSSPIVIKKMIPGKLLTGTVYGGPAAISRGHDQVKKYIMEQNREEVALPYEVPVINNCAERDTSRWITRICYPVY